jgi:hypothetical protein
MSSAIKIGDTMLPRSNFHKIDLVCNKYPPIILSLNWQNASK